MQPPTDSAPAALTVSALVPGDDVVEHFSRVAAEHPRCFWLDGGGARAWSGRRSLIGWLEPDDVSLSYDATARRVLRHTSGRAELVAEGDDADVFAALESELAAGGPEAGDWFGFFGYAARTDLPASVGSGLPDAVWMRPREFTVFDHEPVDPSPLATPMGGETVPVPTDYADAFAQVQESLHAGDSYEVNLTYRLRRHSGLDPLSTYLSLRSRNPAPYAGFLQHDVDQARVWLLSSSPERYALVTHAESEAGRRVLQTKPIKGTTPRGATPEADAAAMQSLREDTKFFSENLMIVDLLRNDLSMVCEPGTVEVPDLMAVETYTSVHQLVSTIRGELRPELSTVAALRALFPAGSMTGAPKLRTMEIIERVEGTPRGVYSGAFGWIAADGRADLGVIIRSLMTSGDGQWQAGTGGGITVKSDCAEEWAESQWKAERLLAALAEDS